MLGDLGKGSRKLGFALERMLWEESNHSVVAYLNNTSLEGRKNTAGLWLELVRKQTNYPEKGSVWPFLGLDNIFVSCFCFCSDKNHRVALSEIVCVENKVFCYAHPGVAVSAKPAPQRLTQSDRPAPSCQGLLLSFSVYNSDKGRGEFSKGVVAKINVGCR